MKQVKVKKARCLFIGSDPHNRTPCPNLVDPEVPHCRKHKVPQWMHDAQIARFKKKKRGKVSSAAGKAFLDFIG